MVSIPSRLRVQRQSEAKTEKLKVLDQPLQKGRRTMIIEQVNCLHLRSRRLLQAVSLATLGRHLKCLGHKLKAIRLPLTNTGSRKDPKERTRV
jgi:hypothetical protein